jgi:hypothetical protein
MEITHHMLLPYSTKISDTIINKIVGAYERILPAASSKVPASLRSYLDDISGIARDPATTFLTRQEKLADLLKNDDYMYDFESFLKECVLQSDVNLGKAAGLFMKTMFVFTPDS